MGREVPESLSFVSCYLDSVDVDEDRDDLLTLDGFRHWLREHDRQLDPSEADLALARELRDELREMLHAHGEGHAGGSARLDELAAGIPLHTTFTGGEVGLAPAGSGVLGMLGEVLAAVAIADRDGTWHRLKLCREDTCAVVFYDRSKNGSRCWCSMQVCGNRNKTRAYRGRQRT
jgi:predicted RNA-binding Zn ribbon-like protein